MLDQADEGVGSNGEPRFVGDDGGINDRSAADTANAPSDPDEFDRSLQEHLARASDLMRQALALQGQTERDVARSRAEADRRLDQERRQHRAVLTTIAEEVAALRATFDRLSQLIDDALATIAPAQRPAASPPAAELPNQAPNQATFDQASDAVARTDAVLTGAPVAATVDDRPPAPVQSAESATSGPNETLTDDSSPTERLPAVTEDIMRQMTVLVHGVPRAAAALSLQRHLAALPHVEGVEAREYAEGILRLQVTVRQPLTLDDLQTWDGGAGLEPVHVQADVIEVRLPGAAGF